MVCRSETFLATISNMYLIVKTNAFVSQGVAPTTICQSIGAQPPPELTDFFHEERYQAGWVTLNGEVLRGIQTVHQNEATASLRPQFESQRILSSVIDWDRQQPEPAGTAEQRANFGRL